MAVNFGLVLVNAYRVAVVWWREQRVSESHALTAVINLLAVVTLAAYLLQK